MSMGSAEKRWEGQWRRFWFGYTPPQSQVALFRMVFFVLVGLDAWFQICHAPRYGAGGFNVSHLPALDPWIPLPSRTGMVIVYLLQAYLAFRVALGAAARRSVLLLTVVFGYGYFVSQLNSYQHHYLLFLLLVICCLVDWNEYSLVKTEPDGDERAGADDRRSGRTAWALRLLLVQVSIVYVWTAVAKIDPLWLDGSTLAQQVRAEWARRLVQDVFGAADGSFFGGWGGPAKVTVALELFLAVAMHSRILRYAAVPLGVAFHLSIEYAGFSIGFFSWFMLAVYLLVIPGPVFVWLSKPRAAALQQWNRLARRIRTYADSRGVGITGPIAVAVAAVAGVLVLRLIPLPGATTSGVAAAVVMFALLPPWRRKDAPAGVKCIVHAGTHLLVCASLLVLAATTDQVRDHYRYRGGDARRRGDHATAVTAYENVVKVDPTYTPSYLRLGALYLMAEIDQPDRAAAAFQRAQTLDPGSVRAIVGEALAHYTAGRRDQAAEAAARALDRDPENTRAKQILEASR